MSKEMRQTDLQDCLQFTMLKQEAMFAPRLLLVSGVGLANAADISHLCAFFFGWRRIPYTVAPSHYMHDGHGFAVHIVQVLLWM